MKSLLLFVRLLGLLGACTPIYAQTAPAAPTTPAPAAAAAAPAATPTVRGLNHKWDQIQKRDKELDSRGLMEFALKATALHWPPEKVAAALDLLASMQDKNPQSKTYGNFAWDLSIDHPVDLNAAEFTMKNATVLWNHHRQELTPDNLARLKAIMDLSIHGIESHHVDVGYTNIFLMKICNCISIGEAFGNAELTEEGYRMLDQWIDFTYHNGLTEYNSTTYNAVDFDDLCLITKEAGRPAGRAEAEAALHYIYLQCRADWFAPDDRLGGPHSRDYDYLRGHGYTDTYAQVWGWMVHTKPPAVDPDNAINFFPWIPTDPSADAVADTIPRFVWQRTGPKPENYATQYVGKTLDLGVAGSSSGPEDKFFTINYDGGPTMTMANFFMDGRGDPYGQNKVRLSDGHVKAHHLVPVVTSAQQGTSILLFSGFGIKGSRAWDGAATCLNSHLDLPVEISLYQNGTEVKAEGAQGTPLDPAQPIFLRYNKTVVGLKILAATDVTGKAIVPTFYRDADPAYKACRISWVHSAAAPTGEAHVVFLATAAEDLDDAGFQDFQKKFTAADASCNVSGDQLTAQATTLDQANLTIGVNLKTGDRTLTQPAHSGILEVNGTELGQPALEAAFKNHSATAAAATP